MLNIHLPSTPAQYRISDQMREDLLWDPVLGIYVLFGFELDVFQQVRVRHAHFASEVEDSSGAGTGKTTCFFLYINYRAALMPDTHSLIIYQHWSAGKSQFWKGYANRQIMTPFFRAQIGEMDLNTDRDKKGIQKDSGTWQCKFKRGSTVALPAPNHVQEGRSISGEDTNLLYVDEANKVMFGSGGFAAVTQQLFGRVRRSTFNKHHPVWANKTIRSSTAELGNHPAAPLHAAHAREVAKGNRSYVCLGFSYKDYSNKICHTGKTFQNERRDDVKLKAHKLALVHDDKVLAEQFGIWSRSTRGWYSDDALQTCQQLGVMRRYGPVLSRAGDPHARGGAKERGGRMEDGGWNASSTSDTVYFLGLDMAPSRQAKNDDGALVVVRANAISDDEADLMEESNYEVGYCYGRRVKAHDVEAWSGLVHEKQQDFGFENIVLDHGGGGQWLLPQLAKERQIIRGATVNCTPIVRRDDRAMPHGLFLVVMFQRKDTGLVELFPDLKNSQGDEFLKHFANTQLKRDFDRGLCALLPPECAEEWKTPEEKWWAWKLCGEIRRQCGAYGVAMKEDGLSYDTTARGAYRFTTTEKDDFHDAFRNAMLGFHIWLHGRRWRPRRREGSVVIRSW